MQLSFRLLASTLVATALPVVGAHAAIAATPAAATCAPSQVSLTATPSSPQYGPGDEVRITISMHNHSTKACSYALGPVSPNFVLTNAAGVTVWGSCWFGGGPAPCAQYLVRRTLAAGATYRDRLTWDQRTGHPDLAVPAGRYTFHVNLSGVARRASTSIVLTSAP